MTRYDIIDAAKKAGFKQPWTASKYMQDRFWNLYTLIKKDINEHTLKAVEIVGRMEYERGRNESLMLSKPLSDEALRQIIEEECKRTGWTAPPTIQVARAVERAHGIVESEP